MQSTLPMFHDPFDDEIIKPEWTLHNTDADRTIVEADDVLTIKVEADTDARWWGSQNFAPKAYMPLPVTLPLQIIAKINPFTLGTYHETGIWIGHHNAVQGGNEAWMFGPKKPDGEAGIGARKLPAGHSSKGPALPDPPAPLYLKIEVDEDKVVSFWYGTNGLDWTLYQYFDAGEWHDLVISDWFTENMEVGLVVAVQDAPFLEISTPFEFFTINNHPEDFLSVGQTALAKFEVYVGDAWEDLSALNGKDYVEGFSISLGGAGKTPNPIAGSWDASISNENSIFHPQHPDSAYKDWLKTGRHVRISVGARYGDIDHFWQRVIGYMNVPKFSAPDYKVAINGGDYMKFLQDFELRNLDNYWGTSATFNSIASDGVVGEEVYAEGDAMEIGGGEADNVTNWVTSNVTFVSLADEGGGSDFVGKVSGQGVRPRWIKKLDVGSATAGKMYQVKFKHRIVGGVGNNSIRIRIDQASGRCIHKLYFPTDTWKEETLYFRALDTGAIQWWMRFTPIVCDIRLDQFSIKEYTPYWEQYYELPGASKGPYHVTLDGDPVVQGEEDEGWFYTEDAEAGPDPPAHPAKIVWFDHNKKVANGNQNLIIYYFTVQSPENVLADLLVKVGRYASQGAALAAMDYDATGVTIDKVWFKPGSKCLNAVKLLCERCDYRFHFKYDGTPIFKPKAAPGATSFAFTDPEHISSVNTYQDLNEIKNRIVITGMKQAEPINKEETLPPELRGEDSDATSIAAYGERTLTISNHLFQTQAPIDAMVATLLAEYKDPRWYSDVEVPFNPAPLEMGDEMSWKERLSPVLNIMKTGIIRDIKIDNFNILYVCEIKRFLFFDDFYDGIRNPAWTDEPNNGTVVESGGVLTLAIANGVDGKWLKAGVENAPFAKLSPAVRKLTVITKLNSFTVNDETAVGLHIGSTTNIPDDAGGYCFAIYRVRAGAANGLSVADMGKGAVEHVSITTLPIWLRIVISGSGGGETIDFDYSTDGENWTTLHAENNLTWSMIGLHARNWGAKNAISAPFEFFQFYEF